MFKNRIKIIKFIKQWRIFSSENWIKNNKDKNFSLLNPKKNQFASNFQMNFFTFSFKIEGFSRDQMKLTREIRGKWTMCKGRGEQE